MSRLRQEGPALAVLGLILVAGLVLRVLHNDHGLPYVYYVDEGSHFTKRAIEVFRDPNPGYFQNPSAFTYLLHAVYRLAAIPAGGSEAVIDAYKTNASWVFEVSRTLAALLCLAGVGAVYAAGRALWDRRTGLLAAAVLCFAFLPVAFSRMALTDTGTLAPVAVALWMSIRLAEGGGLRTAAAAGAAVGLAIGFKYTAGLIVLAPALGLLLRRDARFALRGGLVVLAGALVAFALTNPFFFLDFDRAMHQLRGQAELAGNQGKFGQEDETGVLYYLDSLLWGLGYAAAAASLAGAVLLARRDRARAALLLVFPVALFLYLSFQSRFFGRWLLPVYPALALLAGYAVARGAEVLRERAPRWEVPALALTCAVLLWQPLAADARSMAVLGHEDTRAIAREWLAANHRPELRAVIEPAVPERFYWPVVDGKPRKTEQPQFVNEFVRDTQEEHVEYGRTLEPGLIDRYRRRGYCTVVTMGLIRGRADAKGNPGAVAYYDRLERESEPVFRISPYRQDSEPQDFSFDLSYSYYSPAYERPGPDVRVYRLDDCTQGYGAA
ncbi:MAG: glycosyltransferase family 39 protein [Solirubrobacteraceae bacterium]